MTTRLGMTIAATATLALGLSGTASFAAPIQDSGAPTTPTISTPATTFTPPVQDAQEALRLAEVRYKAGVGSFEDVEREKSTLIIAQSSAYLETMQARYRAGIASTEELEQAKFALATTQATERLRAARALYETRNKLRNAGSLSSDDLNASLVEVLASEVALIQVQMDSQQHALEHKRALVRAGINITNPADAEVSEATLAVTQIELREAQLKYKTANLALLKSCLDKQQTRYKAGVGSKSDVDKAQADYDAATRLP